MSQEVSRIPQPKTAPKAVYVAIGAVQAELSKDGITKDRKNQQQGYSFRGIDDVYNALSPLLAKHGLCVLPRILSRTVTERETKAGSVLFSVVVEAEFDFVAVADASMHTVRTYGEAMDSADKATNKAMSAAYKYAAFMTFAVPTEGDNDSDGQSHDVVPPAPPKPQPAPPAARPSQPPPNPARAALPPAACPKCGKSAQASKYPKEGRTHYCYGCKLPFRPGDPPLSPEEEPPF